MCPHIGPNPPQPYQYQCAFCGAVFEIVFDYPHCSTSCRDTDAALNRRLAELRNDKSAQDDDDQRPIDPQTTPNQE